MKFRNIMPFLLIIDRKCGVLSFAEKVPDNTRQAFSIVLPKNIGLFEMFYSISDAPSLTFAGKDIIGNKNPVCDQEKKELQSCGKPELFEKT